LVTILTRFGHNSKYVVIGDGKQADIGEKSGFNAILKAFNDAECEHNGIHAFKFTENDIVRSKILKLIARKLQAI
jgi:phosphate starvation-inducible protein PhoH